MNYEQLPYKKISGYGRYGYSTESFEEFAITSDGSIKASVRKNDGRALNPFFSVDQEFIDKMQNITTVELAQSVPHIKIRRINPDTLQPEEPSFNVSVFNKQIDFNEPANNFQADRPIASLKDLSITTEEANGPYYITRVNLNIKIHRPAAIRESALLHLFTFGENIEVQFGWNSPNEHLAKKESFQFIVAKPSIAIGSDGQIDFALEGVGVTDRLFFQMYIGNNKLDPYLTSLEETKKRIIKDIDKLDGRKSIDDKSKIKGFKTELINLDVKIRTAAKDRLAESLKVLITNEKRREYFYEDKIKKIPHETIRFGDLVHTLLEPLVEQAFKLRYPSTGTGVNKGKKFTIVMGTFNDYAGNYAGQSLANFEIPVIKILEIFRDEANKGLTSLSFDNFLSNIKGWFESDELYTFKGSGPTKVTKFQTIVFENKNTIEWWLLDIEWKKPDMSEILKKSRTDGATPLAEIKKTLKEKGIPYLAFGHVNTMIKSANFSPVEIEGLAEHLIAESWKEIKDERKAGVRTVTAGEKLDSIETGKVNFGIIPIQGTLELTGHVDWKPFRTMWIDTQTVWYDMLFCVLEVSHTLSSQGFVTTLKLSPLQ